MSVFKDYTEPPKTWDETQSQYKSLEPSERRALFSEWSTEAARYGFKSGAFSTDLNNPTEDQKHFNEYLEKQQVTLGMRSATIQDIRKGRVKAEDIFPNLKPSTEDGIFAGFAKWLSNTAIHNEGALGQLAGMQIHTITNISGQTNDMIYKLKRDLLLASSMGGVGRGGKRNPVDVAEFNDRKAAALDEYGKELLTRKANEENMRSFLSEYQDSMFEKVAVGVGTQVPNLMMAGGVALASGGSLVPALVFGAQSYATSDIAGTYTYMKRDGMSLEEATKKAQTGAIVNGLIETGFTLAFGGIGKKLGLGGGFEDIARTGGIATKGILGTTAKAITELGEKGIAGQLMKTSASIGMEMTEENAIFLAQSATESLTYNPEMSWGDIVEGLAITSAVTMLTAGPLNITEAATSTIARESKNRKELQKQVDQKNKGLEPADEKTTVFREVELAKEKAKDSSVTEFDKLDNQAKIENLSDDQADYIAKHVLSISDLSDTAKDSKEALQNIYSSESGKVVIDFVFDNEQRLENINTMLKEQGSSYPAHFIIGKNPNKPSLILRVSDNESAIIKINKDGSIISDDVVNTATGDITGSFRELENRVPVTKETSISNIKNAGLSGKMAKRFEKNLNENHEKSKIAYAQIKATKGGKILDVNHARKLFAEFEKPNQAAVHSLTTHKGASKFVNKMIDERVSDIQKGDAALFLSGGEGSGKVEILESIDLGKHSFVVDGTFSNLQKAEKRINKVLKKGGTVELEHVASRIETAIPKMIEESEKSGRAVPLDIVARDHYNSQDTAIKLADKYKNNDNVKVKLVDGRTNKEITLDKLKSEGLLYDNETDVQERARKAYEEQDITKLRKATRETYQGGKKETTTPSTLSNDVKERAKPLAETPELRRNQRKQIALEQDIDPVNNDSTSSKFKLGLVGDSKATKWLMDNMERMLLAKGQLPQKVFDKNIIRKGLISSEAKKAEFAVRDLYKAIAKEAGIGKVSRFFKGLSKVPEDLVNSINNALSGKISIDALPESIQKPAYAMRNHIDRLSHQMVKEGIVPDDLAVKIDQNAGTYLTRTYKIFKDPDWAEKIPIEVRNKARNYIRHGMVRERNASVTDDEANTRMLEMLEDWRAKGDEGFIPGGGGKLGSKNSDILKIRSYIAPEMRALMGEYKDPAFNYLTSISKQSALIANSRFLNSVKDIGTKEGWLFDDGKSPVGFQTQIAAKGSKTLEPLNGLRTSPEIARAFAEFEKSSPTNGIFKTYMSLVTVAKTSKTVGSLMTQARNILGQPFFFLVNGHYNMTPALHAFRTIGEETGARTTLNADKYRNYYEKLLELGIVDQSTIATDLRKTIEESNLPQINTTEFAENNIIDMSVNTFKKGYNAAAKVYQTSDDLGKIIGFENEKARQRDQNPKWTDAQVEREAATRIRNTYPNYGMAPALVKDVLRRLPFGDFAVFASETFRTGYWNLRYMAEDLTSGNSKKIKSGIQRAGGMIAVGALGKGLEEVSKAFLGVSDQEEEDIRDLLAPWDANADLVFFGLDRESHSVNYANFSYSNPYSYLIKPVAAVLGGATKQEEIDEVFARAFSELLSPFASESIFATALLDIARNKDRFGREVYNPSSNDAPYKVMGHIYKSLEPGTLTRLRTKVIPGFQGQESFIGGRINPYTEIANEFTGIKRMSVNFEAALRARALQVRSEEPRADRILKEIIYSSGDISEGQIMDAYREADETRYKIFQDLYRTVQGARRMNLPDEEIIETLKSSGMNKTDRKNFIEGVYTSIKLTSNNIKRMNEKGNQLPSSVADLMNKPRLLEN